LYTGAQINFGDLTPYLTCGFHKGNTERRITVTSSLNEISTVQLRKMMVVRGGGVNPFYSRPLDRYLKTT
jgi:hypothetical protein